MRFLLTVLLYFSLVFLSSCGGYSGGSGTGPVNDSVSSSSEKERLLSNMGNRGSSSSGRSGAKEILSNSGNAAGGKSSDIFWSELDCATIFGGVKGWSFDIPKDCLFNPSIKYGSFTESEKRGGQTYRMVTIGEGNNAQTWMAENLNFYDATLDGQSYCYDAENSEDTPNCAVTGRLYTWAAAMGMSEDECGYGKSCNLGDGNIQGVCPDGWHIPKCEEWELLFSNVGGLDNASKVLRSQRGWDDNGNGTDAFGFSALPAGRRYDDGHYTRDGELTYFWSSSEEDRGFACSVELYYHDDRVVLNSYGKTGGLSVRCLKD